MSAKKYRFAVVAETYKGRRGARNALLLAFATRKPDDCRFNLLKKAPKVKK